MDSKDCSSSPSSSSNSELVSLSEFGEEALVNMCSEDIVADSGVPCAADKNSGVVSDDESSSSNSTVKVDPVSQSKAKGDSGDLVNNNLCDDKLIGKDAAFITIPRSLFDHAPKEVLRMRKEAQKQQLVGGQPPIFIYRPKSHSSSDWSSSEDKMLLRVIHEDQGIPLNFIPLKPGHLPNWDLAAEAVNSVGSRFKSPHECYCRFIDMMKMCREGEMSYGYNPEMPKKAKQMNQPIKRMHLHEDEYEDYTNLFKKRIKMVKELAEKRNAKAKNGKIKSTLFIDEDLANLRELGINYDEPLSPMEIAKNRKERIHKKWKSAMKAALSNAYTEGAMPATHTSTMEFDEFFESDSEDYSSTILASGTSVSATVGSMPDSTIVQEIETLQEIGTKATNVPTDSLQIPCEMCRYVESALSPDFDSMSLFSQEEQSTNFSYASEDERMNNPPVEHMNVQEMAQLTGRGSNAGQPSFCICNYTENNKN